MNWEALGAIAEGLGAAGVLVTLIYLVGQVRTNNRLIFSEGRRAAVQNINQLGLGIADNRQMAELFVAGKFLRCSFTTCKLRCSKFPRLNYILRLILSKHRLGH